MAQLRARAQAGRRAAVATPAPLSYRPALAPLMLWLEHGVAAVALAETFRARVPAQRRSRSGGRWDRCASLLLQPRGVCPPSRPDMLRLTWLRFRVALPPAAEARDDRLARAARRDRAGPGRAHRAARLGQLAGRLQMAVEMSPPAPPADARAAAWCACRRCSSPRWLAAARARRCSRRGRSRARTPRSKGWTSACAATATSLRAVAGRLSGLPHRARASLKAGTGFHGRLPSAKRDACQDCHPDHRGRDFPLSTGPADARRSTTREPGGGYKARTRAWPECESPPQALIAVPAVLDLFRRGDRATTTYLGLTTRCSSCHFDEHRGQLGADCQRCHNETKWTPAPGFDHGRVGFALRGKHTAVACAKCHPSMPTTRAAKRPRRPRCSSRSAATFMQMKPIEHRTCESCHRDPHQGKLGPACSNCHTETGWRVLAIKRAGGFVVSRPDPVPAARRPHRRPLPELPRPVPRPAGALQGAGLFPLRRLSPGRPRRPARRRSKSRRPIAALPHRRRLLAAALRGRAARRDPIPAGRRARCHRLPRLSSARRRAWPARVPAGVRRLLRVEKRPLEVSLAVLRPPERPDACADCHADPHAGQFAAQMRADDCGSCHVTDSFHAPEVRPRAPEPVSAGGRARHAACGSCHPSERNRRSGQTVVRYKPLPITCAGCHADEHQGQFGVRGPHAGHGAEARARPTARSATRRRFKETHVLARRPALHRLRAERQARRAWRAQRCHPRVEVAPGVRTATVPRRPDGLRRLPRRLSPRRLPGAAAVSGSFAVLARRAALSAGACLAASRYRASLPRRSPAAAHARARTTPRPAGAPAPPCCRTVPARATGGHAHQMRGMPHRERLGRRQVRSHAHRIRAGRRARKGPLPGLPPARLRHPRRGHLRRVPPRSPRRTAGAPLRRLSRAAVLARDAVRGRRPPHHGVSADGQARGHPLPGVPRRRARRLVLARAAGAASTATAPTRRPPRFARSTTPPRTSTTPARACHTTLAFFPARFAAHDACFTVSTGSHRTLRCQDCHANPSSLALDGLCANPRRPLRVVPHARLRHQRAPAPGRDGLRVHRPEVLRMSPPGAVAMKPCSGRRRPAGAWTALARGVAIEHRSRHAWPDHRGRRRRGGQWAARGAREGPAGSGGG